MSNKPTVKELDLKLKELVDWSGFALHLPGIIPSEIEIIKRNNRDDIVAQKIALYDKWLQSYPAASWDNVIKALETADKKTIAKKLTDGMLSQRTEKTQTSSHPLSPAADQSILITPCEEVIVHKDMSTKLKELEESFLDLRRDIKSAVEVSISNGSIQLQTLKDEILEQRTFPITELESVTTPYGLFNVLRPHYNFLSCQLIIFIGKLLSGDIADRAKEYSERIEQFKHSTKVRYLKDMLKHHHPGHHGDAVIVKIVVEDCWGEESLKLVEILVKTLFPVLKHSPDELQWYRVTSGSLVLSLIGSNHMTATLIEQSSAKIGFMKLVGIISLRIGDKVIWKQDELIFMFSLKNCLIQATLADNLEVAEFLLEHAQVDVNVIYDSSVLINVAEECFLSETEVIERLDSYHEAFQELIKDIEYYSPQLNLALELFRSKNTEVQPVVFHLPSLKNFLDDKILADHNLLDRLPQLSHRIEVYMNNIVLLKRQMVVKFLSGILPKYVPQALPTYTQITVTLQRAWGECSVHYIEQLGELAFSSSLFHEFQLIKVESDNIHVSLRFLVPDGLIGSTVKQIASTRLNENSWRSLGGIKIQVVDDCIAFSGWCPPYMFIHGIRFAEENGQVNPEIVGLLKQLIQAPKDFKDIINADDNDNYGSLLHPGSTPLIIACCKDNSDMVRLLLHHKANPNIRNNKNLTALMYSTGNTKLYKTLIDHGADVSARAFYNQTTLYCACLVGNVQVVKLLLSMNRQLVHLKNNDGEVPLHMASEYGHVEIVRLLLKVKVNPNIQDENKGKTALMLASSYGHTKVVELLLEKKVDISLQDKEGRTALMLASYDGYFEIVELLLKHHSDPNVRCNSGKIAFHFACQNGHIEVVDLLLQAKSDPSTQDLKLYTPLHLACLTGQTAIVERLLQINSPKLNIDVQDSDEWTPLMHAASRYGHSEIVELLLKNKANPNLKNVDGCTALMMSSCSNDLSTVDQLLKMMSRTTLNTRSNDGLTALFLAGRYGCAEVVKRFIQENVSLNICDNDGFTPLMIASLNGHVDVVDLLLCQNVDPNVQSHTHEFTALMLASVSTDCRNIAVVDRLLLSEADPNKQNENGWTALMGACNRRGQIQIVQRLVEKGANLNIQNNNGNSALMLANFNRHLKIVKYLLEENTDLNLQDGNGLTMLMQAVGIGNEEVVEWLIQKDASLDIQDNYGQSALHIACANGKSNIVEYLLKQNANPNLPDKKGSTALIVAIHEFVQTQLKQHRTNAPDPNNMAAQLALIPSDKLTTIVKLLLRKNANPNVQNVNAHTALSIACTFNLTAVVDCLLQYNADPNIQDNTGSTPLMRASKRGYKTLVYKLLEVKANPNIVNNIGESSLLIAIRSGNLEIAEYLIHHHADVNIPDQKGRTPILEALCHQYIDIFCLLFENHADPNIEDNKGRSAAKMIDVYKKDH